MAAYLRKWWDRARGFRSGRLRVAWPGLDLLQKRHCVAIPHATAHDDADDQTYQRPDWGNDVADPIWQDAEEAE